MYTQVSNTPDSGRSATTALPRIVVTDTVFRAEELVSFLPHQLVIDPRQPSMTPYKLLGSQPPSARKWAQFSDLNTIASDVVSLSRFHSIHNGRRVVAKLSLTDDAHELSVAPRSPARYID
jgi:hypothetical protein